MAERRQVLIRAFLRAGPAHYNYAAVLGCRFCGFILYEPGSLVIPAPPGMGMRMLFGRVAEGLDGQSAAGNPLLFTEGDVKKLVRHDAVN